MLLFLKLSFLVKIKCLCFLNVTFLGHFTFSPTVSQFGLWDESGCGEISIIFDYHLIFLKKCIYIHIIFAHVYVIYVCTYTCTNMSFCFYLSYVFILHLKLVCLMSGTGILQVSEQSSPNRVCSWAKEELGFDLLALNPMSRGHVCCAVTNTHSLMLRMASYFSCILCV